MNWKIIQTEGNYFEKQNLVTLCYDHNRFMGNLGRLY